MAKREIIVAKQEKAYSYLNPPPQTNERRVKDFRADLANLRNKFETLKRLHSESVLSHNRNELFGRRGYNSGTPENPYNGPIKTNAGLTKEMMLERERTFIKRTERQLDEFIGRGMAVLDNLVEQRSFLKVRFCYVISDL